MTVKVFMLPCRNKIILYGAKPQTVCLQVSCTRTAQKCISPKGSDCTFIITRKSLLRSLRPCRLPVQSFWGMLGRVFVPPCHSLPQHATLKMMTLSFSSQSSTPRGLVVWRILYAGLAIQSLSRLPRANDFILLCNAQ